MFLLVITIVHGCTIKDNVLIGMGSVIMDGCIIESNSIVAGSVVLEGTVVEFWYYFLWESIRK